MLHACSGRDARLVRFLKKRRRSLATHAVASLSDASRLTAGRAAAALLERRVDAPVDFSPRVADAGPARLRDALRDVVEQAARIHRDSPAEDLHELRIRTKRLRYTSECFLSIYGSDLELFVDRATVLQDVLGEFNDACVAIDHLEAFAADEDLQRDELLVLGAWIERQRRRAADARARFDAAWGEFDAGDLEVSLVAVLRGARPA